MILELIIHGVFPINNALFDFIGDFCGTIKVIKEGGFQMKKIYCHGQIVTMDEHLPKASAVLIEDGKIVAVGDDTTILQYQDDTTECIDLMDKTMLPGFIDGHSHFVGLANALSQCDLKSATNFDELIALMKAFIEKNPPKDGQWVFGANYDHNFLKEQQHPTKEVLNQISTTIPIVVVHASSHMGVANDAALKVAGLDDSVENPVGGRYGRDAQGHLNGYMEENAFIEFQGKAPMVSGERLLELMVEAQKIYAQYGITTIQEGMVSQGLFQLLQFAAAKNLLKQDIVAYIDLNHDRQVLQSHPEYLHQYQNHLKIGGYKVFLDGSPQGRTAWMSQPYEHSDDCGYPVLSDERLHILIEEALEDRQQVLAHCNGDAAAEQYITQFTKVKEEKQLQEVYRPVMIHAQLVRKDQLKRMAEIGMMPSFFIAHTYYWGDIHLANFGKQRGSHISPAKTAQKYHLPMTFHQDSPVLEPDMARTLWCAVNRITKGGVALGDDEKVSIEEALKAVTVYGAYQYFEEAEKGSITVGKRADLVILDQNPLTIPKENLADLKVLETIKDGETIYQIDK